MNKYLVRNFKWIENLGKVPAKVYRLARVHELGVHRIVIFAEAEYSAECSLPKPNILPNIRHAE